MDILDEDETKKITYSPECQATFNKYKNTLIEQIVWSTIGFIIVIVALYGFSIFMKSNLLIPMKFLIIFWLLVGMIFLVSTIYMITGISDLKKGKLVIYKDTLIKITTKKEKNATVFFAELEAFGVVELPLRSARNVAAGTVVYVVLTGSSRTLLDIIPVDRV